MEAVLRGLATGDEAKRRCTQACLLSFLNNKDPMDSSWGAGEVGALLKMRTDGCSWEQIQGALGPGHSIAELFYKFEEVSQFSDAGFHPTHCAHSWATRYNTVNGFHIPFLTGGDWVVGDEPQLVGDLDNNTSYNDFGGLLSVGAPTAALRSYMVRSGRLSGSGADPLAPLQAQPQESGQGANGSPSGNNVPATGTSLEEDVLPYFSALYKELVDTQRQLSAALETNTQLRAYSELCNRSVQNANAKLERSYQLLSIYRDLFMQDMADVPNNVNSDFHFLAEDLSDPNALQNGQDDGLDQFRPDAADMNYNYGSQSGAVPTPHPVETLFMARIAADRWRRSPWSQGGTLPVPVDMPAPDLSAEEMVQLQKLITEYETALRGGLGGAAVTNPHDHRAHGNKEAKRGQASRKHSRREKKTVTIAASDSSSSSEESDSDSDSDTNDNHGEGPSSSSRPSGHRHVTTQPQSQQQQSQQQQQQTVTSSCPDYWIHVLGGIFPPRRGFAPDSAWSAEDCWILGVIESKYDALRYKQYQADFYNATGRMVPATLIRAKMARDACPLVPSSAEDEDGISEDANDISSSSSDAASDAPTEADDSD